MRVVEQSRKDEEEEKSGQDYKLRNMKRKMKTQF